MKGFYHVISDANIFLFGGAKTGVEGETENIESLCVHPLTAAGEKVYSVALLPLSLMHWVGIKTINGLKALGLFSLQAINVTHI